MCVFHPSTRPSKLLYVFLTILCWTYFILMFVENMFFSFLLNYFKIANFDFLYLENSFFFHNFVMDLCYTV